MSQITIVTGNPHKLAELQKVFPATLDLVSKKLQLDEIQSLDLHKIVKHKLHQAYDQVGGPVIIEDVSAELEKLNGLPGPFVKFVEEQLGRGGLYKLGGAGRVKIICSMGYFDGQDEHIIDGIIEGNIVEPRGSEGFGFDFEFIPDGYDKTMSELGMSVKNTMSHRFRAAKAMAEYLQSK
jgi:inosine triphosphate pyrophosphatase